MQKDFSKVIKETDPKELARLAYFYHVMGIMLAGGDNVLRTSDGTLIPIDFGNVQCMGFHSKEQSLDYGKPTWIAMPVPLEDQAKLPTLNDTGSFPFDAGAVTFKKEEGKPSIKDQVKSYFGQSLSDKFYTDNDARFNGDILTLCPYKGYLYRRSIMFDNPDLAKNYILPFSTTRDDQALKNLRNFTYSKALKALTQTSEKANPEIFYTGPDYLNRLTKRAKSIIDYFDKQRDNEIRDYYLERTVESDL